MRRQESGIQESTMDNSHDVRNDREGKHASDVANPAPATPRRRLIRPAIGAVFQFVSFIVTLPLVLIRGRRASD